LLTHLGEHGGTKGIKRLLYTLLKLHDDYNAVKKGRVGRRVQRRVAGKATGKAFRKLFK
jgi:hypothetical protein